MDYTLDKNTLDALYMYIYRQYFPIAWSAGYRDNAGRWYPRPEERQDCCDNIREPSQSYPHTLLKHCCTAVHISTMFSVDPKVIRSKKILFEATPLLMTTHCKEGDRMYNVFKGLLQTGRL